MCWLENQENRPTFAKIRDYISEFIQQSLPQDNYYLTVDTDAVCFENEGYEVNVWINNGEVMKLANIITQQVESNT